MIEFRTVSIADRAKEVFEQEKLGFERDKKMSILLSHFGYFSQDLVNGFTEGVEEMLVSANEKKGLIKRVFSVMIEGLQNIRFHGETDELGKFYGLFFIAKDKKKISLVFGSIINQPDSSELESRLNYLNGLTEEEVKEHFLEMLSTGTMSNKGNAGLGIITMRMKSKAPLKYTLHQVSNEKAFFTLEVSLLKEL